MNASPSHRLRNLLMLAVPLALLAALGIWYYSLQANQFAPPRASLPPNFLQKALVVPTALAPGLTAAPGELVASPPKDPKDQIDPDKLVFAVLGRDVKDEANRLKELTAHLAKATGKEVEIVIWEGSIPEQMAALRKGTLHLADLSTGSVSTAVNEGGFVPFCVMADAGGKFDITSQIVVPADSPVKSPADLKGSVVTFGPSHSHSSFKTPLVTLWKEFNLEPGLDYESSIAEDQDAVIVGVAGGKFKAGAVASDLLKRWIDSGKIDGKKIRTIYTSTNFPPQCFGYAHQLKPELADKIKSAFLTFDWKGSGLENTSAGASKFVEISYKKDWAPVRQMEEVAARYVQKLQAKK